MLIRKKFHTGSKAGKQEQLPFVGNHHKVHGTQKQTFYLQALSTFDSACVILTTEKCLAVSGVLSAANRRLIL